ncbi:MAG: YHS domain-containing (seleno)protein [Acidiferrobacterales bacterium]
MVTLTSKTITRTLLGFLMAAAAMSVFADSPKKMVATGPDNVAIKGYDTVAYFTEGQPMKGKSKFVASWNDAEWHFANAAHRDLFTANPERYAPQFGGFCAQGLSRGKKVVADPEAWTIVDGKLYIKFSKASRDRWRKDKAEKIKKAEESWATYQKQN